MAPSTQQNGNGTSNGASSVSRFDKPASRVTEEYERGPDVWSVFNPLNFPSAVNLGQGFMNFQPPRYVLDEFSTLAQERTDVHHYSHPKGRPRLRKAVADYIGSQFRKPKGKDVQAAPGQAPQVRQTSEPLDLESEIIITAGANGGMYCALAAFLEPGDEVLLLEPYFDQYEMEIKFNQGELHASSHLQS
jgi:kynurenine aminotransferase